MVSGKGDAVDRIVGLELGADDYISKPFYLREVLARVRAVLRRRKSNPAAAQVSHAKHEAFRFGEWTLDVTSRELKDASGSVRDLTTGEFNLLELFIKRQHRVLSRDEIMDLSEVTTIHRSTGRSMPWSVACARRSTMTAQNRL